MKKNSCFIFLFFIFLIDSNFLVCQSKYQEMIKKGFSAELLSSAGIFPDSNDFQKKNNINLNVQTEDDNNSNEPKTLEELAQKRGIESLERQMRLNNTNEQMTSYTFNTEVTNYERFKNSPCFDKIGFNPLYLKTPEDVKALEEIYKNCEYQYTLSKIWKGSFFGVFVLVLVATIYFGIGPFKIKNIFSKKSSAVINEMEQPNSTP